MKDNDILLYVRTGRECSLAQLTCNCSEFSFIFTEIGLVVVMLEVHDNSYLLTTKNRYKLQNSV